MDNIISLWMYEIRLAPVLLALVIFSSIQMLRKVTKIEYTPSYFAIFPLSMLDRQLADYFDEFMTGEYLTIEEGREKNPSLYIKAWVSMFLTFLFVPLITGFIVAFILTRKEFTGFLILLISTEGIRCLKAMSYFYRYDRHLAIRYFFLFYVTYIFCLGLIIRFSFNFASPFTENHEYSALFLALEAHFTPFMISAFAIAIMTNLFAHYLINKDSIKPSLSLHGEIDENDEMLNDEINRIASRAKRTNKIGKGNISQESDATTTVKNPRKGTRPQKTTKTTKTKRTGKTQKTIESPAEEESI